MTEQSVLLYYISPLDSMVVSSVATSSGPRDHGCACKSRDGQELVHVERVYPERSSTPRVASVS